jgi:hypothetical protein
MTADEDARALLIPGQCDIREYGAVADVPGSSESSSVGDSEPDVQDGVRRIEAVARTWSKWGLVVAYMRSVDWITQESWVDLPLTRRQHLPHGLHRLAGRAGHILPGRLRR